MPLTTTRNTAGLTAEAWAAVGGSSALCDCLELIDIGLWLGGPLPIDELAVAAVGAGLLAAAELAEARTGWRPAPQLSGEHAAVSFQSERHARQRGRPLEIGFAPLSRFVSCAEGSWLRTHANYPHHARALMLALDMELTTDTRAVRALEDAASSRTAIALENAIVGRGGCAAAVRSPAEWEAHPAARAARRASLIQWDRSIAIPQSRPLAPLRMSRASTPADGVQVLDLTRVIAGPVAGRTLAALGATVLRIDPPALPEIPGQHLDTGPGKRSALLDLAEKHHREFLLDTADVVLMGYRHGALKRFGLDPESLAARHPHLVQVSLSAWGAPGPWAERRGFDSLVQAACGIAAILGADGAPGALPAQVLDHATGHLMAAAALHGLAQRALGLELSPASLSLLWTASTLLDAPRPPLCATELTGAADPERFRATFGDLALISPPGRLDGTALGWRDGPHRLGSDVARWGRTRGVGRSPT